MARWVSISTAAGGGRREKLKLPRSKAEVEVRGTAPDGFRVPQRARSDNPKIVGSSSSPATSLPSIVTHNRCHSVPFLGLDFLI